MQLITARLHGSPRTVTTKYGQKVVADATAEDGAQASMERETSILSGDQRGI
jgi:hypothetical protein